MRGKVEDPHGLYTRHFTSRSGEFTPVPSVINFLGHSDSYMAPSNLADRSALRSAEAPCSNPAPLQANP